MTQQYRADWQPYRGQNHSPENPVIFNSNNTKDIALIIFETPLHDQQQDRDAVRGKASGAKKGDPGAAGEGPEGCWPPGWHCCSQSAPAPSHAGAAPAPRGSRLPEHRRAMRKKMGSQCQKYMKLCNLCMCQGCKPSQTTGLPGPPAVTNPRAAHGEPH